MNFKKLLHFLARLQKNNNKEWMDANRKWYQEVRDGYISWLDELNRTIASFDDAYYDTPGKKGINRINNNLMFHPNKPIYKDHFGAGLDKAPHAADFYIEIGVNKSFLAGGLWRPDPKRLRSVREAIDYDGARLEKMISKKSFVTMFGSLYEDEKLKSAPKGYSNKHPHIHLLRHKTFAVVHELRQEEVLQEHFKEKIIAVYKEMLPFRRYLNQAISV
ncbi:DUF2461 domain-containing protein [Arenibacter sp. GZD96]|uniref:DUF2461 domain-containing protein n=1 Tax=Aurantibrevibacter litoralis TaxID=3106030 RepID=UPI002AFFB166|nr:DUF2461 domain-containing protein [Arenibacter sp. GZD-96]MEA1786034.1 DUF2461 domain-containing protein [Arenibacter sp. GZD-96]